VSAFPTLIWDGTTTLVGASLDDATGVPYRSIILDRLHVPSAFKLTVNSVDFRPPTGSIDLDIEVMEGGIDVSNMFLRMAVTEDHVPYGGDIFDDVTHDMIDDVPVTVSNLGEVQNVVRTFPVDPIWVTANLEVIAFLQDDTDKRVHAAETSRPKPDYSLRYYALGGVQQLGPSSGSYHFENFAVYNVGIRTDNYTVDLISDYPAGWFAEICDETICYGPTYNVELAPGEFKELHVAVVPASPGNASFTVELSQAMVVHTFPRVLEYSYLTDDLDVLIVDDDGTASYESYLVDALSYNGYTNGVWNRAANGLDAGALNNFPVVVWSTGSHTPTLDPDDRAALSDFLDAGGSLFITGQDIAFDLLVQGGGSYPWFQDYLHATFAGNDANDYTLDGVPGDPISGGIDLVIQGGDGAGNQESPDDIDLADASASVIWAYSDSRNGALRADTGTYKVVYLAFGFEAINNAIDRRAVMQRSMAWLTAAALPSGWVPTDTPLLMEKRGLGWLEFSWGSSCVASDSDYEIYEGQLGDFTSHTPVVCSTNGNLQSYVLPSDGDHYFLIVPRNTGSEGSYGTTSDGVTERPPGSEACFPQLIGECQ